MIRILISCMVIFFSSHADTTGPGRSLPHLFELSQDTSSHDDIHNMNLIAFQIKHHQKMVTNLERGICFPIVKGKKSIEVGNAHEIIPYIRYLLKTMGYSVEDVDSKTYDPDLAKAVVEFQKHHFLDQDGVIGSHTHQKMILCFHQRVQILKENIKKLHEFANKTDDKPHIIVNLPTFTLFALNHGKAEVVSRVVIGKPSQATPEMVSNIISVVANPTWGVPPGIMKRLTLPKIRKNPDYLDNKGFTVRDSLGNKVDPASINWHDESSYGGLKIRQRSGEDNALGVVKLQLDNNKMIYLHDTPSKELFNKPSRALSSGCVRVQKIQELAKWVLAFQGQSSVNTFEGNILSGKTQHQKVENKIPVHLVNFSTWVDRHGNVLWNDPYKRAKNKK